MDFKRIWIIVGREFSIRVKKKSFLLTTIFGPLLMAALIIVPSVIMVSSKGTHQEVAVLDQSGIVMPCFEDSEEVSFRPVTGNPDTLRSRFRSLGSDALLVISPLDTNRSLTLTAWSEKDLNVNVRSEIRSTAEEALRAYRLQGYNIGNLDAILEDLNPELPLKAYVLGEDGEAKRSIVEVSMGISYVASFLIYMFIFMFGNMVMRSVIDEKSNRIVEVIVSSVKPFELMVGKILGVASVAVTQFAVWIVLTLALVTGAQFFIGREMMAQMDPDQLQQLTAMGGNALDAALHSPEAGQFLSVLGQIDLGYIVGCFFIYFVLGYLLYAAMFAAVGSAVDNEADTQQLILPVTAPLIIGLFIMLQAFQYPDSPLAFWASVIPFTSPMVMMARVPFEGGVPAWELALSVGLLLVTFLAMTWISAKIYRTGILMYGKKVTFRDLWKWLKY